MTALGKLVRSTAFRLTLVYLLVFALYAAALLAYFALNTGRLITEQITETVDAEITGLTEQYTIGGLRQLVLIVENRSLRPGSSLYLVTAPTGQALAGNVGSLAPGVLDKTGWSETVYRRLDEQETAEHCALVRVVQLSGGFRLLVGRDLEERARMRDIIVAAARGSVALVIVLGLAGGFFVTRRVLKRFDAVTDTTQRIMAGDLSGRLPVTGIGDELDRLAINLNAMLERIEALMRGLKEVSDNIAHDLKTPLTRLRNRCEAALRTAKTETDYRAALEGDDRRIRRADPHLRRAADDRACRVRSGARQHDRVRRRRDRARRRRTLRAARRGEGADAHGRRAGARDDQGQSRTSEPGARQSGRQRDQICAAPARRRLRKAAGRDRARRRGGKASASCSPSPIAGRASRKPIAAARSSASCACTQSTVRAGLRPRPQPRGGGRAAARRRTDAGRQCAGTEGCDLAAKALILLSFCQRRRPARRRFRNPSILVYSIPAFAGSKSDGRAGETRRQERSSGRPRRLRRRSRRRRNCPRPRRRARASTSGSARSRAAAAGKAIKQLLAPVETAKLGDVVAAIAEASPYLWDLIRATRIAFSRCSRPSPRRISRR